MAAQDQRRSTSRNSSHDTIFLFSSSSRIEWAMSHRSWELLELYARKILTCDETRNIGESVFEHSNENGTDSDLCNAVGIRLFHLHHCRSQQLIKSSFRTSHLLAMVRFQTRLGYAAPKWHRKYMVRRSRPETRHPLCAHSRAHIFN